MKRKTIVTTGIVTAVVKGKSGVRAIPAVSSAILKVSS